MATSQAVNATGSTLWKEDGAFGSGNYVKIAEQVTLEGIEIQTEFDDVTNMDSTQKFHERIPVLLDAKPVNVTAQYLANDSSHNASTGLIADQIAMTKKNFQVRLANNIATMQFTGYVSQTKADLQLGKKMGFTFAVTPTGAPTMP